MYSLLFYANSRNSIPFQQQQQQEQQYLHLHPYSRVTSTPRNYYTTQHYPEFYNQSPSFHPSQTSSFHLPSYSQTRISYNPPSRSPYYPYSLPPTSPSPLWPNDLPYLPSLPAESASYVPHSPAPRVVAPIPPHPSVSSTRHRSSSSNPPSSSPIDSSKPSWKPGSARQQEDQANDLKKRGQIAEALGIADCNFSRKLRKELPQEEKEKIFSIIQKLSQEVG